MKFRFNEEKAGEAAAFLLRLAGGRLPYLTLIKLLYLADRQALVETGRPITGDAMYAMDNGPVLSAVLDRIKGRTAGNGRFRSYVSKPHGYDVELLADPPEEGELSRYECDVLSAVFNQYGRMGKNRLIGLLHETLPEWKDPRGSSQVIDPATILRTAGWEDAAIAEAQQRAERAERVRRLVSA